jgi:pimeloyl-ACP methyl ester carboxylesterase
MPFFDSSGIQIHYEAYGRGKPILLVHGFASSLQGNWVAPGWTDTLSPLRRVIAIDCRGHGESEKPHEPEQYGEAMIDDGVRLLDHLGIETADLFGYSMGSRISLGLLVNHGKRFDRCVLGGVGARANRRNPVRAPIAEAMEADSAADVEDSTARGFRIFAERTGADLKALAAIHARGFWQLTREDLSSISQEVLIVTGEQDNVVGSPEPIASAIPNSRTIVVPDRDHLTVVGDQRFKDAVVAFLNEA